MKITEEVFKTMSDQIVALLKDYEEEVNEAYIRSENDKLGINLSTSLEPAKDPGTVKVKTTISFVKDRVKDEAVDYVETDQMDLFDKEERRENE